MIVLLTQDMLALDMRQCLGPGTFLAFTHSLPGTDNLPQLDADSLQRSSTAMGCCNSFLIALDREEVDVLVVIYEMVC